MKTIPWVLAVVALAAAAYLYLSGQTKATELARLQGEVQALAGLRAEVEELKKNQVPADELTRLRKNTEELIRLRNTVRQLNVEKTDLAQQTQKAQTEIQRAQSQAQAAQAQAQAAQAHAQAQADALAKLTPEQQAAAAAAARYGVAVAPTDPTAQLNACINNLRQIDSAMQQWALENGKPENTVITAQDHKGIAAYIKGNALPKCPAGGTYTFTSLVAPPTCSIPGHAMRQP